MDEVNEYYQHQQQQEVKRPTTNDDDALAPALDLALPTVRARSNWPATSSSKASIDALHLKKKKGLQTNFFDRGIGGIIRKLNSTPAALPKDQQPVFSLGRDKLNQWRACSKLSKTQARTQQPIR